MRWSVGLIFIVVECTSMRAQAQAPVSPAPALPPPPPAAPPRTNPAPPPPTTAPANTMAPATTDTPPAATAPATTDAQPTAPPLATAPVTPAPGPVPAPAPIASEPTPPPPPDTDKRVPRARRPFYIAGELGWNGLSGLGVNFGYHPDPHLAIDTGLGLSLTGLRAGVRLRANFLTGEWTPFLGAGFSFAGGPGDQEIDFESKGEKAKGRILASPFVQLAGGVNYTGSEGFMFTATTGYSILARKGGNTRFVSGSQEAYDDIKPVFGGGLILSVVFGYAF